jgi:hypothetical protein
LKQENENMPEAKKRRIDRYISDHLYRQGLYQTADALSIDFKPLVDGTFFMKIVALEKSLETQSLTESLQFLSELKRASFKVSVPGMIFFFSSYLLFFAE